MFYYVKTCKLAIVYKFSKDPAQAGFLVEYNKNVGYFTYVIKSEYSGKIYIGQTDNLTLRLRRHNGTLPSKKGSYTKLNKGPWKLVYHEVFNTRHEAIVREKYLKSHSGRNWLNSIITK